jgi:hypothetical protein
VRKVFFTDYGDIVVYAQILNLFDTKQILNVYPNSGSPYDDGWLKNEFATAYKDIPNYEAFYRAVNLKNRYAYMNVGATGGLGQQGGGDIFGAPRQIIFGVRFEM